MPTAYHYSKGTYRTWSSTTQLVAVHGSAHSKHSIRGKPTEQSVLHPLTSCRLHERGHDVSAPSCSPSAPDTGKANKRIWATSPGCKQKQLSHSVVRAVTGSIPTPNLLSQKMLCAPLAGSSRLSHHSQGTENHCGCKQTHTIRVVRSQKQVLRYMCPRFRNQADSQETHCHPKTWIIEPLYSGS